MSGPLVQATSLDRPDQAIGRPAARAASADAALLVRIQAAGRLRRRRSRLIAATGQVGSVILLLGLWGLISGRFVDAQAISNPVAVLQALVMLVETGRLWPNLWQTLVEVGTGFGFGTAIGLGFALLFALMPGAQAVLRPFLVAFYSIPKIALAPLVIMWFGLGTLPKVVLAASFVFFVVFMNVAGGIEAVNPQHVQIVRIMGGSRMTVLRKVILPSALPFLMTGLRLAIPEAVIGAVIGEFIAADFGLGYLVSTAAAQFNTAVSLAAIIALLLMVGAADLVLNMLERRFLRWRPILPDSAHSF